MTASADPADLRRSAAPAASRRHRMWLSLAGTVPFFGYTAVFLILPTILVVVGAFRSRSGDLTLNGISQALTERTLGIFANSLLVSAATALVGTVAGAILAYALATARPSGLLRRGFTAFMSVLAQFGGVMLAFAFIATIGVNGMVTRLLMSWFGTSLDPAMLSTLFGVGVVYSYFQIPLMVIVFLPALDGLKPQWREATATLGGTTATYWTRVAAPILWPSVLGSYLLLFANSFSAFATAAALISQQTIIVPMEIEAALRNENDIGMDAYAQALALGMIVVVALIMWGYAVLDRRASRWSA